MLVWKGVTVPNTQAYLDIDLTKSVKSFLVYALGQSHQFSLDVQNSTDCVKRLTLSNNRIVC